MTTSSLTKKQWLNQTKSNDPTKALEAGLASCSLSSNVSLGRQAAYSVSSLSSAGEEYVHNKEKRKENVRENDDLDYSTCSESGDDSPTGIATSYAYLSPIGKVVNSSTSSPLQRTPNNLNANSDIFAGDSLYFMEVRSASAAESQQKSFNIQEEIKEKGTNSTNKISSDNGECTLFGNITSGNNGLIGLKDGVASTNYSNEFGYTGSCDKVAVGAKASLVDNFDNSGLSNRNRANSVPLLPHNIKYEADPPKQSDAFPLPWDETNLNLAKDGKDEQIFGERQNSSSSLLEGLRMGTLPFQDEAKTEQLHHKPSHVKSYSSDLTHNYLFRENTLGVLSNNVTRSNDSPLSKAENLNSNRDQLNTYPRKVSRQVTPIPPYHNRSDSIPSTNSFPDNFNYSQLGGQEFAGNTTTHNSLPETPNRGYGYFDHDDSLLSENPLHRGNTGFSDNVGTFGSRSASNPNTNSNLPIPYNSKEKGMSQKELTQQPYDVHYSTNQRQLDHHLEENFHYLNRNHFVEINGLEAEHANLTQPPQMRNCLDSRYYNNNVGNNEYNPHSFPPKAPYPSTQAHSAQPHPGQFDNYGYRGSENLQRQQMLNDRHRNMNEPRQDASFYRMQGHAPPIPPRVIVPNTSNAPPLLPRPPPNDDYENNSLRVANALNSRNTGHQRVLSSSSIGNHSHGGIPSGHHQRILPPEFENRVRCHSYGGQTSPNHRGPEVLHTIMHPPRFEGYQTEQRTMIVHEPVLVNGEPEYFSVGSYSSHSADAYAFNSGHHAPMQNRPQEFHEFSSGSRSNSFVSVRNDIQGHPRVHGPMNHAPASLMVRSISTPSTEPPYVGVNDLDENGMPILHPQILVANGTQIHYNRPHSSSTSSMDRLQNIVPQFVGSEATAVVNTPRVVYNVKFKRTQRSFIPGPRAPRDIKIGCYVKVEADRGEDLGFVVSKVPADKFHTTGRANFRASGANENLDTVSGNVVDLKKVVRLATRDEVALLAAKREEEDELLKICRAKVQQRGLSMNVVDAEYQFDRHKLTFFFEAESRIDFRELVRDLFSIYKTRIWMQQLDKNGVGVTSDNSLGSGGEGTYRPFPPPEVVINKNVAESAAAEEGVM